jgi:DNA-binding transcriptional LysR family regulator
MDSLGRFTLFVQVAEAGSFVAASHQLGISASAVGKGIARLEERLGVSLFRRNTRSISLTEEGLIFLERCRRILSEIEGIELELSKRQKPSGKLKVTMPLVNQLLLPILSQFHEAYPDINLELDFNDRIVDLVNEGFDIAIRTGEPQDSLMKTRRLGGYTMMLVAAPRYLERHGTPRKLADLIDHACLHHRYHHSGKMEEWPLDDASGIGLRLPTTIVCNNIEALRYLTLEARGIACLPDFSVRECVAEGSLRHILARHVHSTGTFRVFWPASRHLSPRIRAFVDFIAARVSQDDNPSRLSLKPQ